MKKLDVYIINEFYRCRMINEDENLTTEELEAIDLYISSILADITEAEKMELYTDSDSVYGDIKKYAEAVLNKNNLVFSDNRCYSYFYDALYEILK